MAEDLAQELETATSFYQRDILFHECRMQDSWVAAVSTQCDVKLLRREINCNRQKLAAGKATLQPFPSGPSAAGAPPTAHRGPEVPGGTMGLELDSSELQAIWGVTCFHTLGWLSALPSCRTAAPRSRPPGCCSSLKGSGPGCEDAAPRRASELWPPGRVSAPARPLPPLLPTRGSCPQDTCCGLPTASAARPQQAGARWQVFSRRVPLSLGSAAELCPHHGLFLVLLLLAFERHLEVVERCALPTASPACDRRDWACPDLRASALGSSLEGSQLITVKLRRRSLQEQSLLFLACKASGLCFPSGLRYTAVLLARPIHVAAPLGIGMPVMPLST
nr:cTAGE family member 15-like [Microcebus murinus]